MPSKHVETVQGYLRTIGWPLKIDGEAGPATRDAIRQFQRGYTFVDLPVDSHAAPDSRTFYRLRRCATRGPAEKGYGGHMSRYFRYIEFASHGNRWIKCHRLLVRFMEKYRKRVGHAVELVSPYRDPRHNAAVGGAECSYHTDACGHEGGQATDVRGELTVRQVKAIGPIGGIGYSRSSGLVLHVDVGPVRSWTYALARVVGARVVNKLITRPQVFVHEGHC